MANMSTPWQPAKCYSNEGSRFHRNSGYQFLQQLSPRRGSTALDLGCGTGYLAAQLSDCVGPDGKVIAVDPDEERLKIAREKYARDNIEYVSGNDATFPEGPYDLLFANYVIHYVADKNALFGRVYQSLKSGGWFVCYYIGTTTLAAYNMQLRSIGIIGDYLCLTYTLKLTMV